MKKRLAFGVVAVSMYVVAGIVHARTGPAPRPLYDGLAPAAPYRFVEPPSDLADDNELPEPGEGIVDIVGKGSAATSISTGDGQLQIVLQKGTFPARKGEKEIEVALEPLAPPEPMDLGDGLRVEGNAYSVTAVYRKSLEPARPKEDATIVVRYPFSATVIVRREGAGWRRLKSQISKASLQLFGSSDELGIFAAAGKPHAPGWRRWIPYAAAGLGVIAGAVGYLSGRRSRDRRRRRGRHGGRRNAASRSRRDREAAEDGIWKRLRAWLRR